MKTYKKIDIYTLQPSVYPFPKGKKSFVYECSTLQSKTCKEAKKAFCEKYNLSPNKVKANFALIKKQLN